MQPFPSPSLALVPYNNVDTKKCLKTHISTQRNVEIFVVNCQDQTTKKAHGKRGFPMTSLNFKGNAACHMTLPTGIPYSNFWYKHA
jgi:hypothetical protein